MQPKLKLKVSSVPLVTKEKSKPQVTPSHQPLKISFNPSSTNKQTPQKQVEERVISTHPQKLKLKPKAPLSEDKPNKSTCTIAQHLKDAYSKDRALERRNKFGKKVLNVSLCLLYFLVFSLLSTGYLYMVGVGFELTSMLKSAPFILTTVFLALFFNFCTRLLKERDLVLCLIGLIIIAVLATSNVLSFKQMVTSDERNPEITLWIPSNKIDAFFTFFFNEKINGNSHLYIHQNIDQLSNLNFDVNALLNRFLTPNERQELNELTHYHFSRIAASRALEHRQKLLQPAYNYLTNNHEGQTFWFWIPYFSAKFFALFY